MKQISLSIIFLLGFSQIKATVHTVQVWDGYLQFLNTGFTMQLGDTVEWAPLDQPMMTHTITSTTIPTGAASFDQIWEMPADTFFRYIPTVVGTYHYVCTPHEISFGMVGNFIVVDSTVGIKENQIAQITTYPNPVVETLIFESDLIGTEYIVTDLTGKQVLTGTLEEELDVRSLVSGKYFIRFFGDKPKYAQFIKQ